MLVPLLTLLTLALMAGALLGLATRSLRVAEGPTIEQINALLPQTQCGQCGHPGCKPYAQAIATGAAINKCPPGGKTTIAALAGLMGEKILPLDPAHGVESTRKVAFIREAECIGCTKCIQACPVDAILGSAKHMHTVIERECTGCDLCVEPCPVDCIDMLPAQTPVQLPPVAEARTEQPCIRCGFCVDVCPAHLLPQQLYWFARSQQLGQAQAHNLHDCIECGACAWVCPSHIPLVTYYQHAKAELVLLQDKRERGVQYQSRFDQHQLRIAEEKFREEQRRAERAALAARRQQASSNVQSPQDIIAAAVARVQAKKAAQQHKPPGDGNDQT